MATDVLNRKNPSHSLSLSLGRDERGRVSCFPHHPPRALVKRDPAKAKGGTTENRGRRRESRGKCKDQSYEVTEKVPQPLQGQKVLTSPGTDCHTAKGNDTAGRAQPDQLIAPFQKKRRQGPQTAPEVTSTTTRSPPV